MKMSERGGLAMATNPARIARSCSVIYLMRRSFGDKMAMQLRRMRRTC